MERKPAHIGGHEGDEGDCLQLLVVLQNSHGAVSTSFELLQNNEVVQKLPHVTKEQ